jgi:CheY-like chemotaxis protein
MSRTILIAEDEAVVRDLIRLSLEGEWDATALKVLFVDANLLLAILDGFLLVPVDPATGK